MEKTLSIRGLFRISRPINLLLIAFTQGMTAHFLIKTNAEGLPVLQDYRLYLLLAGGEPFEGFSSFREKTAIIC